MSWIFGVIGQSIEPKVRSSFSAFHHEPLHVVSTPTLYIASGGIPKTCFSPSQTQQRSGWLAVGCGIRVHDGYCEILSAEQWDGILSKPEPTFEELEGHFIGVKWSLDKVIFYNDRFGLRTLHLAQTKHGVAFSTRIDWLSALHGGVEIDFAEFGSHWQTFNQLSYKSLIKGFSRLGPGGIAVCTPHSISVESHPWTPPFRESNAVNSIPPIISSLLHPQSKHNLTLSLGLSGGLDSRALLAQLLFGTPQTFKLHLFGNPHEPDVQIAQRIANDFHLQQTFYCEPLPPRDICIKLLREYAGETSVIAPASSALRLRYYPQMRSHNLLVVDGGLGEIARRQYMNRLLVRAPRTLRERTSNRLRAYTLTHRGSFFTPSTETTMEKGTLEQIRELWETMPAVEECGEENYADLLALRYRFPNWAGIDQARMDGQVLNYMPFAQPSFVESAFTQSIKKRKGGRLFRELIASSQPALSKYPLVKGTSLYPYWLPTLPAWVWTKVKGKLRRQFVDPLPVNFLTTIQEFVQDTAHSAEVREYAPYNRIHIFKMVDEFYAGNIELASDVDYWLSFEMWRQSLRRT